MIKKTKHLFVKELKPCPICGGELKIAQQSLNSFYSYCSELNCDFVFGMSECYCRDELIIKCNERDGEKKLLYEIEELEKTIESLNMDCVSYQNELDGI